MDQPENPLFHVAVVQFKVNSHKNGGTDKGPDGNRIDSIPIANGCIKAGAACDMLLYDANDHQGFVAKIQKYNALIVRINPGQLSQGTPDGTQARFDATMRERVASGVLVWSSPDVQTKMGAKDALCKISKMGCGLIDTFAYYTAEELSEGFKKTCAFQPRVIKQNRGSAGEGIWLVWLEGKDYCANFGDAMLEDDDKLKLMEMNDNHAFELPFAELAYCIGTPAPPVQPPGPTPMRVL